MSQVVLITGCSTGIGRDLAERLARSGYTVVATARKLETLDGLQAALKLPLDVTQPASIDAAVDAAMERFGRIDVLVNNAGYGLRGAVEEVPVDDVQEMFDANVFGLMRMVQAVAPHMRAQKAGRILNVSSLVGKLSGPVNGTYSATKFALEALSDAMRIELAPFGIQVVLIEPGSIKTQFGETAECHGRAILSNPDSPYRNLYQRFGQVTVGMRRNEPGPEAVSKVIQQAIETSRPKSRYMAGIPISARVVIHLGDSVWDLVARQMYKT